MSRPRAAGRTDRIAGATLLALAIAYALETSRYDVTFVTDPLGPKAFPYVGAALLAAGAAWLIARPGPRVVWPARATLGRLAAVAATLLLYAVVLASLGFLLTTTLAVALLSVLFGARPLPAFAAAVVLASMLYVVFVFALGLPLPAGAAFLAH